MNLKPLDFKCFDFELPIVGCRVSYNISLRFLWNIKTTRSLLFQRPIRRYALKEVWVPCDEKAYRGTLPRLRE